MEDTDEAPHIYGYLCDLIEANNPLVLGVNNSNIPKLIAIMSEAFVREAISLEHDVAKRMLGIIRQIQVKIWLLFSLEIKIFGFKYYIYIGFICKSSYLKKKKETTFYLLQNTCMFIHNDKDDRWTESFCNQL